MNIDSKSSSFTLYSSKFSSDLAPLQKYIVPEQLSSSGKLNWGRLICIWQEKKWDGKILTHKFAACIDGKNGDIYLDCSPTKIFAKCAAIFLIRPFFTLIKTLYCFPCFLQALGESCSSKKEKIKNICKPLADIILTPLYGLALMITTVAVLMIGIIYPENLYDGRKLLGKIEQASNWREPQTIWTLAQCFQGTPLNSWLNSYEKKDCSEDTLYLNPEENSLERTLSNFARAYIKHLRWNTDYFSGRKLNPDVSYESPIIQSKKKPFALKINPVNIS